MALWGEFTGWLTLTPCTYGPNSKNVALAVLPAFSISRALAFSTPGCQAGGIM